MTLPTYSGHGTFFPSECHLVKELLKSVLEKGKVLHLWSSDFSKVAQALHGNVKVTPFWKRGRAQAGTVFLSL